MHLLRTVFTSVLSYQGNEFCPGLVARGSHAWSADFPPVIHTQTLRPMHTFSPTPYGNAEWRVVDVVTSVALVGGMLLYGGVAMWLGRGGNSVWCWRWLPKETIVNILQSCATGYVWSKRALADLHRRWGPPAARPLGVPDPFVTSVAQEGFSTTCQDTLGRASPRLSPDLVFPYVIGVDVEYAGDGVWEGCDDAELAEERVRRPMPSHPPRRLTPDETVMLATWIRQWRTSALPPNGCPVACREAMYSTLRETFVAHAKTPVHHFPTRIRVRVDAMLWELTHTARVYVQQPHAGVTLGLSSSL